MGNVRTRAFALAAASILFGAVLMATPSASAGPLEPALQGQLMQLFDGYNKAIAAGKVDDAVAMRSSETRKQMQEYLGSADKRKELLEFAKQSIPDTVEVKHTHLAKDGTGASIIVIAKKKIPNDVPPGGPPPGTVVTAEMVLNFVKEGGNWKFADQTFGMDPAKIVRCKNEAFEPIDAYDDSKMTSMGGPIDRVAFEADYTLVVVRVVDEENCAYLPNRAVIEKAGLNPDLLVPYAVVEIKGFPHKSDKQKVWVDHITIREE
jgi:hypothetical protein